MKEDVVACVATLHADADNSGPC